MPGKTGYFCEFSESAQTCVNMLIITSFQFKTNEIQHALYTLEGPPNLKIINLFSCLF